MQKIVPHSRPWIIATDRLVVEEVLCSGMISHNTHVAAFEQNVARMLDASGAIACTSGTSALILALKTLGINKGDEVILPTYVCWNVYAAISAIGAIPRLCDVDDSGVLTVQTVRPAINERTRAIVAIHIFGHPCDIPSLVQLGLPVIEDACQAFGLELNGNPAGIAGTMGILSFHATKCLTTGEGGMLVTKDRSLLNRARALTISDENGNAVGLTNMTDLQAALGLAQLKRYPTFLSRRQQLFNTYHHVASKLTGARPGYQGIPSFLFRYTLRVEQGFNVAQDAMLAMGVQTRRGVDELLHRRVGLNDYHFPQASALFAQTLSIPFYPSLNEQETAKVLNAITEVFGGD